MPTTTFCDIKFTETVEDYTYENKQYTFNEGDVVSIPRHTAGRFVNKWDKAEWAKEPYEVRDEEYDDVLCRVRNTDNSEEEIPDDVPEMAIDELSYGQLQSYAKKEGIKANQSKEELVEQIKDEEYE